MEIGAQHFKTVPSNPHYFFYNPQSSKKDVSLPRTLGFFFFVVFFLVQEIATALS